MLPALEAHGFQRPGCRFLALLGRLAAVQQRQLHVFLRRGAGQQVKALEHKAKVAAAQASTLVTVQPFHVHALEQVFTGGGSIQTAQRIHGRGLARAAGAHDGDEIALLNIKVKTLERLERQTSFAIDLDDVAQPDQRHTTAVCVQRLRHWRLRYAGR